MSTISNIFTYLATTPWKVAMPGDIRFLAAGEYNENYLAHALSGPVVVRINHGSQLGLGPSQAEYEYGVLRALRQSGVTPQPFHVDSAVPGLGQVLLMEYLEGAPLDYARDLGVAAAIFARIHAQPIGRTLLVQADPVGDIARESLGLLHRFADHPRHAERDKLLQYHEEILRLADDTRAEFSEEPLCMVNTEVNSGNFIIGARQGWLVDWEKGVVSHRYQDLGHFLVRTTTLWKTDCRISPEERLAFLEQYRVQSGCNIDLPTLSRRTEILERTILLRALSWCYMAWYEYAKLDRPLSNAHTFSRIKWYLDEIECFLK